MDIKLVHDVYVAHTHHAPDLIYVDHFQVICICTYYVHIT